MLPRGRLSPAPYVRPREGPSQPAPDPYVLFAAAVLRQAVSDARAANPDVRTEAQRFFRSPALAWWLEVCGADPAKLRGALLQAAGLL